MRRGSGRHGHRLRRLLRGRRRAGGARCPERELGFAVYELFWRYDEAEVKAFWDRMPRTGTWSAVLARAVDLYQQYRPGEAGKMRVLLSEFEDNLEARRKRQAERAQWELYRRCLEEDIEAARRGVGAADHAYLTGLKAEVEERLAESPREESR